MDRKTAGLVGAVAGLAMMGTAHATPLPAPNATDALASSGYADLLAPVPDAVALLKAADARSQPASGDLHGDMQLADYRDGYGPGYPPPAYHHHHHHHHHQAYNHHHHHHHHHNSFVGIPGVGGIVVGSR